MPTRGPTNLQLEQTLKAGFKDVGKRLDNVESKVQVFHDYMISEQAIKEASKEARGAAININPDIMKLLILMATIIAAVVGAQKIQ